jgi:hypothetical protein
MSLGCICLLAGLKGVGHFKGRGASADKGQPGLGQVQLAFDRAQNVVIDPALVAKTN